MESRNRNTAGFNGSNRTITQDPTPMPYHAKAGEADPYAALIHHQVRIAEEREKEIQSKAQKRKLEQARILREQVDYRARVQQEQRAAEMKFDLEQQERHHQWERAEAAKAQKQEALKRAEYQQILAFQEEQRKKLEAEKARAKMKDQEYLQQVARQTELTKQKDLENALKWKEEARLVKMANDQHRTLKAEARRRELEEDKERIRIFEKRQREADARRKADLESMKRNQEILTNLGRAAAEEQAKRDAIVESQIQEAIRRDEERARRLEEEKNLKKAQFELEQRNWRMGELQRKQQQAALLKQQELAEVEQMRIQFAQAQADDARKREEKRLAAAAINQDLRRQIELKREQNLKSYVQMSPAELAMNAQVLNQYSPARPSARSAMSRAGQSIIF